MYIDGIVSVHRVGAEIILLEPGKIKVYYVLRIIYKAINNIAEYESLITKLKLTIEVRAKQLKIFYDS